MSATSACLPSLHVCHRQFRHLHVCHLMNLCHLCMYACHLHVCHLYLCHLYVCHLHVLCHFSRSAIRTSLTHTILSRNLPFGCHSDGWHFCIPTFPNVQHYMHLVAAAFSITRILNDVTDPWTLNMPSAVINEPIWTLEESNETHFR